MSALAAFQSQFLARVFADDEARGEHAIYRRNVLGTLRDALAAAYPVVLRLVGPAFFDEAARRHAIAAPSRCGDLNVFGDGFAAFLAAYPHARGLAYLPDVARLEWAVHECFHAEDAAGLDAAALAGVDPDDLARVRLAMHPAVRLVASPHPVQAIREANLPGRDGVPARETGPDFLLVRRDGLHVVVDLVDAAEWRLLDALRAGATLGDACERFAGAEAMLARHTRAGVFAGFQLAA